MFNKGWNGYYAKQAAIKKQREKSAANRAVKAIHKAKRKLASKDISLGEVLKPVTELSSFNPFAKER